MASIKKKNFHDNGVDQEENVFLIMVSTKKRNSADNVVEQRV